MCLGFVLSNIAGKNNVIIQSASLKKTGQYCYVKQTTGVKPL